ncbi:MAG: flagellar hook-basal body complex protein FliE [Halomonadaceae bacterium]|nr:MAG: flagellar hook-basal body complex protein FliE [Halomonadaceae bacterium]
MVDRADVSSVLADIRSMRSQMQQQNQIRDQVRVERPQESQRPQEPGKAQGSSFGDTLSGAINSVNNLQQTSASLANAYERGDEGVDITRVMVAAQKSEVAFQSMVQVRNRVVQAYEDIMNMPV